MSECDRVHELPALVRRCTCGCTLAVRDQHQHAIRMSMGVLQLRLMNTMVRQLGSLPVSTLLLTFVPCAVPGGCWAGSRALPRTRLWPPQRACCSWDCLRPVHSMQRPLTHSDAAAAAGGTDGSSGLQLRLSSQQQGGSGCKVSSRAQRRTIRYRAQASGRLQQVARVRVAGPELSDARRRDSWTADDRSGVYIMHLALLSADLYPAH